MLLNSSALDLEMPSISSFVIITIAPSYCLTQVMKFNCFIIAGESKKYGVFAPFFIFTVAPPQLLLPQLLYGMVQVRYHTLIKLKKLPLMLRTKIVRTSTH